jgi:hypothetical protein
MRTMKSRRIGLAGVTGGCPRRENNSNNGREERRKGEGRDMSINRKLTTWAGAVALAWAVAGLTAAHAQTTTHVYPAAYPTTALQNAIDASGPGDTLILHGDFDWWDGAVDGTGRRLQIVSKTNLTLIADATVGASHDGNYKHALYISGSSNITVVGITFALNNADGIYIENNCLGMQLVSNCTLRAGTGTGTGYSGLRGYSPVKVVGCRVDVTTSHTGIDVRNATAANSLIVGNTITNCGNGILLWSPSSLAIGNTISHCTGIGIHAGNWNNDAIVRSNTVHHCGTGIGNGVAWSTEYSYNVVYSNTVGIGIDPDNNGSGKGNYKVHHNTVYGNGTGIRIADVQYVGSDQVAANIVVGNGTGINFDNISGSGGTVPAIVYSDVWNNTTDYANDAVGATKTGVVTSDPGFHSTDPAHKRFLQLGPATPSAMLTTGDDSSYVGAAYMGAIEPYFPPGTVISIR